MNELIIANNPYQTTMSDIKTDQSFCFGHFYIIGFTNGMVKVGVTKNPKKRLGTHLNTLGMVADIKNYHVSDCHSNFMENEKKLISFIGENGREIAKADYKSTVDYALTLDLSSKKIETDAFLKQNMINRNNIKKKLFTDIIRNPDPSHPSNNRYFSSSFISDLIDVEADDFFAEMVIISIDINKPAIFADEKISFHEDVVRAVFFAN